MKIKNLLLLGLLLLFPVLSSCSDDKDEPAVDSSKIQGVWECTACKVLDVKGINGLELPQQVIDIIKGQLEGEMVGERITIDKKATMKGDLLIFGDSGISWKILKLTDSAMTVEYDTSSSAGSYGMNMTVKCDYKKVK